MEIFVNCILNGNQYKTQNITLLNMASIQNFTPRLYQETIMASCAKSNCLIILPTGLGKTKTAILAAAQRLNSYPKSKILFLTVTKTLDEQILNEVK